MLRFSSLAMCFKLGLLSSLIFSLSGFTDGFNINKNAKSNLSIRLVDEATNISPISLLFQGKKAKVIVEGMSWSGAQTNEGPLLNYTTFINDEKVAHGSIDLSTYQPTELPTSVEVGVIAPKSTGPIFVRVLLNDGITESISVGSDARVYQSWIVCIPILVSFGLFLIFKLHLVYSLFAAMLIGSCISTGSLVQGFRAVFDSYILGAVSNSSRAALALFIAGVSVFMALLNKSGSTNEILRILSPYTARTRLVQIVVFSIGIIIYFDPYTSILMIGKVIGSVLKGFPLSCDKLAFLVDTTALPVSSVVPGSTWILVASELLQNTIEQNEDGALGELNGTSMIISTIRYQFYPILILILTLLQILLGQEVGPLLRAENEQRLNYGNLEQELEKTLSTIQRQTTKPERAGNWWGPVLVLNALLLAAFVQMVTGNNWEEEAPMMTSTFFASTAAAILLVQIFFFLQPETGYVKSCIKFHRYKGDLDKPNEKAAIDTFPSASASASFPSTASEDNEIDIDTHIDTDFRPIGYQREALQEKKPRKSKKTSEQKEVVVIEECKKEHWLKRNCITCTKETSVLSMQESFECVIEGGMNSVPVIISLIAIWALSDVYVNLGLDRIVVGWILSDNLTPEAIPIVTFVSSLLLSLTLGSSWVTISILIPSIVAPLYAESLDENKDALIFVLACVLNGAVAGDHFGPFSETTILSGHVTNSQVRAHFITQAPYALFVLILSFLVGTVPLSFGAYSEIFGFVIGLLVLLTFIVVVCRRVKNPRFIPRRSDEAITKDMHPLTTIQGSEEKVIEPKPKDKKSDGTKTGDLLPKSHSPETTKTNASNSLRKSHTLQSFKTKLQEINTKNSDPIMELVEDGLLPKDMKKKIQEHVRNTRKKSIRTNSIPRAPVVSKKATIESKKRLIEATIKKSEKDGNIFSDSLRQFLRTAEQNMNRIISEGPEDIEEIQGSSSEYSNDDSLDHLMLDIAKKGWTSAIEELAEGDSESQLSGHKGGGTAGYTTDGLNSVMEDTDDSAGTSIGSSSSTGFDQSTAFTTDNEASTEGEASTQGPSFVSEETPKIAPGRLDPYKLIDQKALDISVQVGQQVGQALTEWINKLAESTDGEDSTVRDNVTKASF